MRNRATEAHPGDLREVHHQLVALSHLLENTTHEAIRFDLKQVAWGLGRVLEGLAAEIGTIANRWERAELRQGR